VAPNDTWRETLPVRPAHADAPAPIPILELRPEAQAAAGFAPLTPDNMPASLELDLRPTTEVDFPLTLEESGEDKERRRRYIEMRYPEVANKTVTVDDPDSVINAARQYFEEGQIQSAAELLTYAFEERPGQLRFWLALFEIYRLERMTAEFCGLAAHFRDFHSGTDVWPKVQHIGRDLDPSNPLFATALGRLGLPVDREFDAIAENWLNAPMDFTSDVLMAELRRSLRDKYGVDAAELQRLQPAAAS
jgi:pilus assembly protein FimV